MSQRYFEYFCSGENFVNSDHYDGKRFYNLDREAGKDKTQADLFKWIKNRQKKLWPKHREIQKYQHQEVQNHNECRITMINHACLLIQTKDYNLITDPVFSARTGPFGMAGPKRVHAPGIALDELPKIDFILLSHNHYDHMDLPALKRIYKKHSPQMITPLKNHLYMKNIFNPSRRHLLHELDWWQNKEFQFDNKSQIKIHLTPAQHWSSRTPYDRFRALWGAFVVETPQLKIYFAGDTGYNSHFKMTSEKLGAMDVSLLPIGAYEPRWFMKSSHMNPQDAAQAHMDLKSNLSIGMHFGCFQLTDEGIDEPVEDLKKACQKLGIEHKKFVAPKPAESFNFIKD